MIKISLGEASASEMRFSSLLEALLQLSEHLFIISPPCGGHLLRFGRCLDPHQSSELFSLSIRSHVCTLPFIEADNRLGIRRRLPARWLRRCALHHLFFALLVVLLPHQFYPVLQHFVAALLWSCAYPRVLKSILSNTS